MAPYFDRRSFFFEGWERITQQVLVPKIINLDQIFWFFWFISIFSEISKNEKNEFLPLISIGELFFFGRGERVIQWVLMPKIINLNQLFRFFVISFFFFKLGKKSKILFLAEGQKNYIRVGRVTKGTYYKNMTQIAAYLPIQMN